MTSPQSIKIVYYDAKGRAEICRLVLEATGRTYENVIISPEDWPTEKASTPFGQLPVLELDGKRYAQSIAMATYLAREVGLYGDSNLDRLCIDQVIFLANDLLCAAVQVFHEPDAEKKAEKNKHFDQVEAPRFFALYEQLLKENGTGYFVGKSLTLADLFIYDQLFTPSKWKTFSTQGYPLLQALRRKIEDHSRLKVYLANRKETEF